VIGEGVVRAQREARATAHALRVSAAHEAGMRLMGQTHREQMAQTASASLSMLLGAEHVVVRLEDPSSKRFRIASYFGGADDDGQHGLFALDKAVTIETIRRRTLQLVRDLPNHPKLGAYAGPVSSMLSTPLKIDGHIVGTIALYDKLTADTFFSGRFNDDDLQVFSHFVGEFDRALGALAGPAESADHAIDEWRDRVSQELARAGSRPGEIALATCGLEDFETLAATSAELAQDAIERVEAALKTELRRFDSLIRLDHRRFGLLLPEPEPDAAEHVRRLARAVSERVAEDASQDESARIVLAFGFAANEAAESDVEAFEARAAEPRIVMV